MARRPTPLGSWGEIRTYKDGGTKYASARFRDLDGKTRRVARSGRTFELAKVALREALAERAKPSNGNIDRDTRFADIITIYGEELEASDRSDGTKLVYTTQLRAMRKALGELRLHECTPGRLDAYIRKVAEKTPGSARTTRQVLKQVMALAVLNEVFASNPVTETRTVKSSTPDFEALGAKDLHEIRDLLTAWDSGKDKRGKPRNGELRDTTDLYTATGARTSEVLALWCDDFNLAKALLPDEEREPATVLLWKTVSRNRQNQYVIKEKMKTDGSKRELELPYEVVPMILDRRVRAYNELMFPSAVGTPRSPDNLRRDWHAALEKTRFEGLNPGLYRKSVATLIARTLGEKAAAEQLGHTGLGNLRYYVERSGRGPEVAGVLGELFGQ